MKHIRTNLDNQQVSWGAVQILTMPLGLPLPSVNIIINIKMCNWAIDFSIFTRGGLREYNCM